MRITIKSLTSALIACVLALATGPAFAQMDPGHPGPPETGMPEIVVQPASKEHGAPLKDVPTTILPAIDHAALRQQDAFAHRPGKPVRIGVGRAIHIGEVGGEWTKAADGGWVWSVELTSLGAYGLRVHLVGMDLPAGAYAVVYNPANPLEIVGPYTGRGALDGEQYAGTIWANTARVEVYVPPDRPRVLPLAIAGVQHMYRYPFARGNEGGDIIPTEGNCHNDVTCSTNAINPDPGPADNYTNAARAVGMIDFVSGGESLSCTGQLMSNQSGDLAPFFLTASHCVSTNAEAATVEVFWLYQTSVCNGVPPALATVPRTNGAALLATRGQADQSLLRLTGLLPGGLFYQGWTATPITPSANTPVACIHHPDSAYKRISFGNIVNASIYCGAGEGQLAAESYRVQWFSAATEGGSSGAGILVNDASNNKLLVGTLSCGNSFCGASTGSMNDIFGRFSSFYPFISSYMTNGYPDDTQEPNDACATPRFLTVPSGGLALSNLVVKINDPDWYAVTVPPGQTLTVTSSFAATSGNIDTRLVSTCGGTVLATGVANAGGEVLTWTNTSASSDEVYVTAFLNSTTPLNTYAMNFTLGAGPVIASNACNGAPEVFTGETYTGTTVGATVDGTVNGCNITVQRPDVWYVFTAPSSGILKIDTCGSVIDTVLSLHTSCGTNSVVCNDDASAGVGPCGAMGNRSSYIERSMLAGDRVYIRIAAFSEELGNFTLHVDFATVPPPSNDTCEAALDIGIGSTSFDTSFAMTDGPIENSCALGTSHPGVDKDVWFAFTPASGGTLVAETCGTMWDTKVALYAGCPSGANTALACDDDAIPECAVGPIASRITATLNANTEYLIRVGGFRNSAGNVASGVGTLTLAFTPSETPQCTPSDVAGPGQSIGHDGELTADDIIVFITWMFDGDLRADFAGPGQTTTPDGDLTADDIIVFIGRFFAGC